MSKILGISAGFHDACASVIDTDGNILFAGHSERYSHVKNDKNFCDGLRAELSHWEYDTIAYYEQPLLRQLRAIKSGERFDKSWTVRRALKNQLGPDLRGAKIDSYHHHLSHAAAGFQTSPFNSAVVAVIDAIGELDTISIYYAYYDCENGKARYQRMWSQSYPHSIGLFYSAITDRVGLKPLDEEYITMGMAAWGTSKLDQDMMKYAVSNVKESTFKHNFHIGIEEDVFAGESNEDIAHAAQYVTENLIDNVLKRAQNLAYTTNLVLMGGVALNCVANSRIGRYFPRIWIMPNPGDGGSSLGAAALAYGKKLNWTTPFLGYDIQGEYPVQGLISELLTTKIVGVANGRAEFGPRALGNRSLLADPRGAEIKDKVNEIKRRQKFRPFAPVILAEHASDYFDMPFGWESSPYMQAVAKCKRPDLFPAIVHVDDTSRVQTVDISDNSGIRKLLEEWYRLTGCPMLLNTSLNIRGEPMVNTREDADRFENLYGIRVLS